MKRNRIERSKHRQAKKSMPHGKSMLLIAAFFLGAPLSALASSLPDKKPRPLKKLNLGHIEPIARLGVTTLPAPKLNLPKYAGIRPGENFVFDVYHQSFFHRVLIGHCYMELGEVRYLDGRWAVRFRLAAESASWYSSILQIQNDIRGYFDLATNDTLFLTMKKRENTYEQDKIVEFDYRRRQIIEKELTADKTIYQQYNLEPGLIDAYSIVYLIRRRHLGKNAKIHYNIYSNGKVYPHHASVRGLFEIDFHDTKRRAYKVEIITKVEGALEQKGGIFVYFANDRLKAPLWVKADVAVGEFFVELRR